MDSVDLSVLKSLYAWQAESFPLWLVTVVETSGSSPRPQGKHSALRGDGLVVGRCVWSSSRCEIRIGSGESFNPFNLIN